MKYVSIDIETLGLNPKKDSIIEFAAIIDDGVTAFEDLPRFQVFVTNDLYCGDPFAMSMNAEILKTIANRPDNTVRSEDLGNAFAGWLSGFSDGDERWNIAGKNFANFDLRFLRQYGFENYVRMNHRIIDVGNMFLRRGDASIPNLQECLKRAGIEKEIAHTALEDAEDVVKAIRFKLKG